LILLAFLSRPNMVPFGQRLRKKGAARRPYVVQCNVTAALLSSISLIPLLLGQRLPVRIRDWIANATGTRNIRNILRGVGGHRQPADASLDGAGKVTKLAFSWRGTAHL
jgi:hypothetical protein